MFKKTNIIKFILLFSCIISVCVSTFNINAQQYIDYNSQSAYYSYEYNGYNELATAPDGYTAKKSDRIHRTSGKIISYSFCGKSCANKLSKHFGR